MGKLGSSLNALSAAINTYAVNNVNQPQTQQPDMQVGVGINTREVYEPWRDSYRGYAYRGFTNVNYGEVEIVDYTMEDMGLKYVVFRSGKRSLVSELSKAYLPFPEGDDKEITQIYTKASTGVEELNPNKDIDTGLSAILADKGVIPVENEFTKEIPVTPRKTNQVQPNKVIKESFNLFDKMKTSNLESLRIDLPIPKKELFKLLESSFENIFEDLMEYILTDKNFEILKDSLNKSLKSYYEIVDVPEVVSEEADKTEEENNGN